MRERAFGNTPETERKETGAKRQHVKDWMAASERKQQVIEVKKRRRCFPIKFPSYLGQSVQSRRCPDRILRYVHAAKEGDCWEEAGGQDEAIRGEKSILLCGDWTGCNGVPARSPLPSYNRLAFCLWPKLKWWPDSAC